MVPMVSSSSNDTSIIQYGSINVVHKLDCYIIRSEKVITSNMEGNIKYLVQQGEKVEKGYKVVELSKDIVDETTRNKLEVIKQRIENLNDNSSLLFQDDVNKLDGEINLTIESIKEYMAKDDLFRVKTLKNELNNKLEKKRIIAGDKSLSGKNIEALKVEQELLEKKINNSMGWVHSPDAGVVSYFIDGYENLLAPQNIHALEWDKLLSIDKEPSDCRLNKVIQGQPIFKIIDSHKWFMIAQLTHEESEYYKLGRAVTFKFSSGDIRGSILKLQENENYDLVIFELSEYTDNHISLRKVNIDVEVVNYEGLKLNNDSIIEKDGKQGVFVLDINRQACFKPIQIIGKDGEYTIVRSNVFYENEGDQIKSIETIKIYDEVVRKAEKVKDGQIVI